MQKFLYNPTHEDFQRLILTKNEFASWAGIDRHRFYYYINTGQLSKKERLGIIALLRAHKSDCDELISKLLLEQK